MHLMMVHSSLRTSPDTNSRHPENSSSQIVSRHHQAPLQRGQKAPKTNKAGPVPKTGKETAL